MKFLYVLFFYFLFLNSNQFAQVASFKQNQINETPMKYLESFKINSCEKITIYFNEKMSDSKNGKPPKVKEISDKKDLKKIILLLNKLPDKGDVMISMVNSPVLKVIITQSEAEKSYFEYYGHSIKTPATSFYSESPIEEEKLYKLLMSYFKTN